MSNELERIYRVIGGKVYLSDEDYALISSLLEEAIKQARAEVSAAYREQLTNIYLLVSQLSINTSDKLPIIDAIDRIPKPAAKDLEALLREAELEMLERIRTDEGGVYVYCPERENTEGPAIIRLDVFIRVKKRQIAELEKARASLEKS